MSFTRVVLLSSAERVITGSVLMARAGAGNPLTRKRFVLYGTDGVSFVSVHLYK